MKIVCERCEKETITIGFHDKWLRIEPSEKGYGKLGDYYLCPKCKDDFYTFIKGGEVKKDG